MASNKLREDMIEYIGIENESEIKKSSSSQDEKNESLKHHVDGSTDTCYPSQNGSYGNSNGNYSQKNEFHVSSEDKIEESSSFKNGIDILSEQRDLDAETLKQNGSCVTSKANISNSDSKNEIHVSSIEYSSPKNGLDVSKNGVEAGDVSKNGVEAGEVSKNGVEAGEVSKNGVEADDVSKNGVEEDGHVYSSTQEDKTSIQLPLSSTVSCISTKFQPNGGPQDVTEHKHQQNELKIGIVDVVMEGKSSQNESHSSNESVSSGGVPLQATDAEHGKRFAEEVFLHLNSSKLQSKMKEIDDLVWQLSTFKTPTFEDGYEMKPAGPEFDSEDKNKPEQTLPKRKSKQSEFEDPEELQLISKKAKMNTLEEQSSIESQSGVTEQFRFAYKEAIDEVLQGKRNKTFNFAENNNNEYFKEKLRFEKELDDIADRVLRAMSLDEDFTRKELNERMLEVADNYKDENAVSRGMQTEREIWKLSRDGYDFSNSSYHRIRISPKLDQPLSNDGVLACSRRPLDGVTESSTFNGTSFGRRLFEVLKSLVLLGFLIPFLFLACVTAKICSLCFPNEECFKKSKSNGDSRDLKRKHLTEK